MNAIFVLAMMFCHHLLLGGNCDARDNLSGKIFEAE